MNKILEINNLVKQYEGNCILDKINLSLEKGSSLAVLGHSGCGKSTLLHLIGLLETPTSGDILISGININTLSNSEKTELRKNNIGFIYQFHYLINELTVEENIALAYKIKFAASDKESVERVMENLNIITKRNFLPNQLSGGEKQRTAIARALVTKPELILADEPTGNLDKANALLVKKDFFNLIKLSGSSLILSTHDEELAKSCNTKFAM